MFRLLTNISLGIHLLVLALAVLLWWPGLTNDFLLNREALLLLQSKATGAGDVLYRDVWLAGPPLMVWIYQSFQWMFGSYGLTALKVLFVVYLYLTAVIFPAVLAEVKALKGGIGFAAVLIVVLAASPWYAQEVHSSLLALWPVTMAFYGVIRLGESSRDDSSQALMAGIWLGIATWASFRMTLWFGGVLVGYLLIRTIRGREIFALFFGWGLVGLTLLLVLFFQGNLSSFWYTGILGYLDQMRFGLGSQDRFGGLDILKGWILMWGPALLLALVGFTHFRIKFYNYLVRIRRVETIAAVWGTIGLALVIFRFNRLDWSDTLLLAPPTAFYAAKVFELKWNIRLKWMVAILVFAFPLYQYLGFWGWKLPETMSVFRPAEQQNWRGAHLVYPSASLLTVEKSLHSLPTGSPILILDHQPTWYYALNHPLTLPYTDSRLLPYRLEALPANKYSGHWSPTEPEYETFRNFSLYPPAAIIDPQHSVPYLQERYPTLMRKYVQIDSGEYNIWVDSTSVK